MRLPARVVWMGDSTLLGLKGPSYPQILAPLLGRRGIASRVTGYLGFDFYGYYFLTAAVAERLRPTVLVVVAHLRQFAPVETRGGTVGRAEFNDLASLLPPGHLVRSLALPLGERGLSPPRLLLAQARRHPALDRLAREIEGARALADDDPTWDLLGPREVAVPILRHSLGRYRAALAESNVAVHARHPTVRMMEATVRLARGYGMAVLVIGTPIPHQAMAHSVGYDPSVYAVRFRVLREVVERSGGTFLDLHEALPEEDFADPVGHFNAEGARRMAALVEPAVTGVVRRAARARAQAAH